MNKLLSRWPLLTLLALTGINLFNYLDRQVLPVVLTPIKAEMGLSDGRLAFISTAFMLGYFITAPIFGYLGDRFSRKYLIAAGVLVWSLGTVLSGTASGFWSLVLFRIFVGLGEASYGTISPGWIADLYTPERRNNALSIFYVAIPVGSALGYLLGSMIAAHSGWRAAFMWAGAPGFLLAVALLFLREPKRGATEHKDTVMVATAEESGVHAYLTLAKRPLFRLVLLGYIAHTFALGAFAFWSPTFLYRSHEMTLEQAGRFFGLSLVATGLVATLLGGFVATAWQKRNPSAYAWMLAISVLGATPACVLGLTLNDHVLAPAMLVVAMFFIFLATGPVNTLLLETVPVTMRASAMAASIFATHLFGDLWSPQIVGSLSDHIGLKRAMLALPVAIVVAACFWVTLALRMRRRAVVG